ncbi:MAG: RidA family protein [Bacteroidia bacterium]|nr:RidA family protein [Bacteroidia bacterium]
MKEVIFTAEAGSPIGPYSQAIKVGNLVFVSGQIPVNPQNGELVTGSIEEATHRVMQNIKSILEAGGSCLENVVKASIFLTNLDDFTRVNAVYGSYFSAKYPARETVQVSRLPKEVPVEISVIAYV